MASWDDLGGGAGSSVLGKRNLDDAECFDPDLPADDFYQADFSQQDYLHADLQLNADPLYTEDFENWALPSLALETDNENVLKYSPGEQMCLDAEHTSPTSPENSICYGAIFDAKVKINKKAAQSEQIDLWSRYYAFRLIEKGQTYHLEPMETEGSDSVGVLDNVTARRLKCLQSFSDVVLTAVVTTAGLAKASQKSSPKTTIIDATVNVSGPRSLLVEIGEAFDEDSTYLQHPCFLQARIEYVNPHYFYPTQDKFDLRELVGPPRTDTESTRRSQGIQRALNSLEDLEQEDPVWGKSLAQALDRGNIVTALKPHQERGIRFILSRENREYSTSIRNGIEYILGISGRRQDTQVSLGGINADFMGLGKTLTMLGSIACTKDAASEFAQMPGSGAVNILTRATLVVVTSRQVLECWVSEINKHIQTGFLKIGIFHGENRPKSPEMVVDNDIVLTTYHTLATDWKRRGLLQKVAWFRVVLDEAHWIRNTTSQQFKAARELTAERRWCLSGTPIQNSLLDLRSLLAFLRYQPLSSPSMFQKHILDPLASDGPESFRNLRLLLGAICIRRDASLLSLPSSQVEQVSITMSDEEAARHEDILMSCKTEFEAIANSKSQMKKHSVLFQTIMKLRRLCNHGTYECTVSTSNRAASPRKKRQKRDGSTKDELLCEVCCADDEDTTALLDGLDFCPHCSQPLGDTQIGAASSLANKLATLDVPSPASLLDSRGPSSSPSSAFSPASGTPCQTPTWQPSKLKAVVTNIANSLPGSKNLVFSSWRLTLDILQDLLTRQGIACLRIDGLTPFAERSNILARFKDELNQAVLLMSIATGAVGLTLTIANRIHIVEPQWNPAEEEQAIARALRMGQTRNVTVVKYITRGTVEQNIVSLQKKKSLLSKISLDGCADGDGDERLEDLKFVLDRNAR